MPGRSIDLNNTKKFLELGRRPHFTTWGIYEVQEETKDECCLETFEGDVIDKCSDEPYLFSPGPNRSYVACKVCNSDNSVVYSGYKPLMDNCWKYKIFEEPLDVTIIIMADFRFIGAVFEKGTVVVLKETARVNADDTSKSETDLFRERVQTILDRWNDLMSTSKFVFIRCTKEDKDYFFEGRGETEDSKYRHIPFETGQPTMRELERVYDRLMRCVIHGSPEETLRDLQNERKKMTPQ